ncbi:unnamed protein product [Agarophyton chilense]
MEMGSHNQAVPAWIFPQQPWFARQKAPVLSSQHDVETIRQPRFYTTMAARSRKADVDTAMPTSVSTVFEADLHTETDPPPSHSETLTILPRRSASRFRVIFRAILTTKCTTRSRINSPRLLNAIRQTPDIQLPYVNYVVLVEDIPGKGLCSRTDVAAAQAVHPETLKPLRQFRFSELHPKLDGPASMAHGMIDYDSGEYFNVVWSYKPGMTEYNVFCTKKSGQTYILATIRDHSCHMHSACFTENYIIVIMAPIRIKFFPFLLSLSIGNAIEMVDEDVKFVVVSRKSGSIARTYSHENFSSMHGVTAFERGDDLVL